MKNKRPAQIKINKNSQSKNKVVSSPLKDNR